MIENSNENEATPKLINRLREEGEAALIKGDKETGETLIDCSRRLGFELLEEKIREDPNLLDLIGYKASLNPVLRPVFEELKERMKNVIDKANKTNENNTTND